MSSWPDFDEEEYLSEPGVMEKKQKNKRFERIWRKSIADMELAKSVEGYEYRQAIQNYYQKKQVQKVKRDRDIALYSWDRKQN